MLEYTLMFLSNILAISIEIEKSSPVQRIRVHTDVIAKLLAVESPALYKGRVDGEPGWRLAVDPVLHHFPEQWPVLFLQGEGRLEVMARVPLGQSSSLDEGGLIDKFDSRILLLCLAWSLTHSLTQSLTAKVPNVW